MPDPDDLEGAGRLRPNLKPLWLALAANLVFGGAGLGWPYLRGQARTEDAAQAFARFAACLLDAEIAARPGITLPRGERARFATLLVRGDAAWPERCRSELARVGPPPVMVLFPSVKSAEDQVREEVAQLDRQLGAIARARGTARVPAAPLETLARLQGALVEQIHAAGLDIDPRREAIELGARDDLPTPSIIPTQMGADRWSIALDGAALIATSVDPRAIGRVRVEAGRVEVRRARRPRLASAVVGAREPLHVIWSTPEAQCDAEPEGCAQRVTGMAAFTEDRQRLTPTAWLRAHPYGEPEDAVHVAGDSVWIAARTDEGGLALRRFALPGASEEGAQQPAQLDRSVDAADIEAIRWIDGEPPSLAWAGSSAGSLAAHDEAEAMALEGPGGPARIESAGRADDGWIVVASERGVRARPAQGGVSRDVGIAPRPPGRGAVRVLCASADGCAWADVLVLRDRALHRVRCDASGCADPVSVAEGVASFDPIAFRDGALVGWSGGVGSPVRVTRLGPSGASETSVPAACWDDEDGLCGEPRVAADLERVVLVTRAGADLRVLESDDGRRWRALSRLEQP